MLCCQKYFDTFKAEAGLPSHDYALFVMAQIVSRTALQHERRLIGGVPNHQP